MVNDVAVIKTGISVSDFRTQVPGASPICLASQEHLGGEKGRVAGFGTTSEGMIDWLIDWLIDWYGMVWYGMVWYGMVWYGFVRFGSIRFDFIWI